MFETNFMVVYLIFLSNIRICLLELTYLCTLIPYFCEGFIFAFFASQEPFAKLKPQNFCCPCAKRANSVSIRTTSNYLTILTPTEACEQVCRSSHPGNLSAT